MKKRIIAIVIAVIAIVVILAFTNKIIDLRKEKPECKLIDGVEVCEKEITTKIETVKETEKVYTNEDGKVQVIEKYDEKGNLKQTESKTTSEDRECIEIREPNEQMPMMAGCRPKNQ